MADELEVSIDKFFERSGLTSLDRRECYDFIETLYPGKAITPASCQGYCSFTVFVGEDTVFQYRPNSYRLDLQVTDAATKVYGRFAPETAYLGTLPGSGLVVYGMKRIEGISFDHFRRSAAGSRHNGVEICKDFAAFLAKSWHNGKVDDLPLGRVGKSIVTRLKSLRTDLPLRFQPAVRNVLRNLPHIEALPWVLTHGDILAANIMVHPSTGRLTGMVDWAEAERLPFGVCLYGLEELLGGMTDNDFQYYGNAEKLREIFWAELQRHITDLEQNPVFEAVKLAKDLGVLLWHGIAFDNGAIDRVVQEGRDVEEIHRLDAFLVNRRSGTKRVFKI